MQKFKIAGREATLFFSVPAYDDICRTFGSFAGMYEVLNAEDHDKKHDCEVFAIFANAGEMLTGGKNRYTGEWVYNHLTPGRFKAANRLIALELVEGMRTDVDEPDDGPRDVVLEELQKKEEAKP